MLEYEKDNPPLPVDHPFTGVQLSSFYWTSTTLAPFTDDAWGVYLAVGSAGGFIKGDHGGYMWWVRGSK
jgi:hypothetical protein